MNSDDLLREVDELAPRVQALAEVLEDECQRWAQFCSDNNVPWKLTQHPSPSDDYLWTGDAGLTFRGSDYSGERIDFQLPRLFLTDPQAWLEHMHATEKEQEREKVAANKDRILREMRYLQKQLDTLEP
jgi:hypothetical protein